MLMRFYWFYQGVGGSCGNLGHMVKRVRDDIHDRRVR